jgi:hypothetical protein
VLGVENKKSKGQLKPKDPIRAIKNRYFFIGLFSVVKFSVKLKVKLKAVVLTRFPIRQSFEQAMSGEDYFYTDGGLCQCIMPVF